MTIRWDEIEALGRRGSGEFPVVSCYLDVDAGRAPGREHIVVLREMVRSRLEEWKAVDIPRPVRGSVERDLEKIQDFVEIRFDRRGHRGLALFASDGAGLFERFLLPCPIGSRLVIDWTPYIRPLAAVREEHPRWGIVLVDRESARILEMDLGAVEELATIHSDVPKKVRAGGFKGYEESRISRNIEDQLHRHLRLVAERAHYLARARHHEGLVLAGQGEVTSSLERFLPAPLAQSVKGRIEVEVRASPAEILEKAQRLEERRVQESHRKLVEDLISTAKKEGFAVLGIEPVLEMLHRGAIHTLVIGASVTSTGYRCLECGRTTTLDGPCSSCRKEHKSPVAHLLDDTVEEALRQGCQVRHIFQGDELERVGSIGALLRFRPGS